MVSNFSSLCINICLLSTSNLISLFKFILSSIKCHFLLYSFHPTFQCYNTIRIFISHNLFSQCFTVIFPNCCNSTNEYHCYLCLLYRKKVCRISELLESNSLFNFEQSMVEDAPFSRSAKNFSFSSSSSKVSNPSPKIFSPGPKATTESK